MAESIIEPLVREHARMRTLAGELRAHTERFDIPGIRNTAQRMIDVYRPHVLKEEAVLFLIGMKFLKADNKKLPELFQSHDQILTRLHRLQALLFSARLTNVEDQARQLAFVILESIGQHFEEEESKVFPALDQLIDDQTKALILKRYDVMTGGGFDDLDRLPLLSLPDEDPEITMDNMEKTQFGLGTI
ncbi:MAG: hemerythrin domain-containing protein [Nitrospira sp.]